MKHIRRFNENLTCSLDITGGENILDLKIEEDIPEHLFQYVPTIGDFIDAEKGYELFIDCNNGETIYNFGEKDCEIYKKEDFEKNFYDYKYIDAYNELIEDEKILHIVKKYFNCDNLKVYLQNP